MRLAVPVEERFWRAVDRKGPDECWPWLHGTNQRGYGNFSVAAGELDLTRRRMLKAHRVAFYLTHGRWPVPEALHGCDNPQCCNALSLAHVHEGSHSLNMRERAERSWIPAGELNSRARLTAQQVALIRLRYEAGDITQAALAAEFGMSRQAIGHLIAGRTWR